MKQDVRYGGNAMTQFALIAGAVILLCGLLYTEKSGNVTGVLLTKTPLSVLFVIAAMISAHPFPGYSRCILTGLVLCLAGDVFLALPQRGMFLFGLLSFLLGHVLYIAAFVMVTRLGPLTWGACLLGGAFSTAVYVWLRPNLGTMNVPVIGYIVVITIMVVAASSVLGTRSLTLSGRVMVFAGAGLFYVSDVFVARDRFLKSDFSNRLIGLPLYYTGQFLLAFSTGSLA
ncbi:lysoplasmalogenase [Thermodesulfobacteriota bacterium]